MYQTACLKVEWICFNLVGKFSDTLTACWNLAFPQDFKDVLTLFLDSEHDVLLMDQSCSSVILSGKR